METIETLKQYLTAKVSELVEYAVEKHTQDSIKKAVQEEVKALYDSMLSLTRTTAYAYRETTIAAAMDYLEKLAWSAKDLQYFEQQVRRNVPLQDSTDGKR